MDPIKLSMESDTLCVILLGVSVYQRYTWISTSFIPWCLPLLKWYFMVLKGYFMFNFLMFYQIEVSLETFVQAVFRLTHILFAATSAWYAVHKVVAFFRVECVLPVACERFFYPCSDIGNICSFSSCISCCFPVFWGYRVGRVSSLVAVLLIPGGHSDFSDCDNRPLRFCQVWSESDLSVPRVPKSIPLVHGDMDGLCCEENLVLFLIVGGFLLRGEEVFSLLFMGSHYGFKKECFWVAVFE